jgi:hypothetical protein
MKIALAAYDIEIDIETAAQQSLKHLIEDAPKRLAGENVADGPLSAAGGYLAAAALMCLATTSG